MSNQSIKHLADQVETTFYFLILGDGHKKQLKTAVQRMICEKFKCVTGVNFYGMRSGPSIAYCKQIAEEIDGFIQEQVNFFLIDLESGDMGLLSQIQRDMFFDEVKNPKNANMLSAELANDIVKRTENMPGCEPEFISQCNH